MAFWKQNKPAAAFRAGLLMSGVQNSQRQFGQYSFFGNCMLRTRLK